jgi:alkylation response protein AidB-like acyl-CoA dehydrogenase
MAVPSELGGRGMTLAEVCREQRRLGYYAPADALTHLDRTAVDWSSGVNHGGMWPVKLVAAKYHAVEGAWRVVDRALDLPGGFGIFRQGPFERLFRDARLGRMHPSNSLLTHELAAKLTLGISPDEQPRWG